MAKRHNADYGALIDLSQIKDGDELKRIIKDFDKLNASVKHQINTAFRQDFNDLSDKYDTLEKALKGNLNALKDSYADELKNLNDRIDEHNEYSESTYIKKTDRIGIDDLDKDLREKLYFLLSNAGDNSGFGTDYNGNFKKIAWTMYFVLTGDSIVLNDVKNKTADPSKVITLEDFFGDNWEHNDFSGNNIEIYAYDRPAESYLPVFYLPVTGSYNKDTFYYHVVNGIYEIWDNYSVDTWEEDKINLYYFDQTAYENELINLLESNNYSKTYVFRNLGEYSDKQNENDVNRVEPECGKVSYNAESTTVTFETYMQTRHVFKLIKYEY